MATGLYSNALTPLKLRGEPESAGQLGFVGFNSISSSMVSTDLVVKCLLRFADGQLENMPSADEMNTNIDATQKWRREEPRPAAQVYAGAFARRHSISAT